MQNLSQNEFNQIERIRNLLRDELEQIDDINKNEISDIRRILNRLRNILPKKDRKEIKDKLYKIEHQRNISEAEREENDEYLRKLVRILNNKEKYGRSNPNDFDYNGITRLAWQACLKKTKLELELLTNIGILLMVEKGTRGGICQAIHSHAKAYNKYMKNYDKDVISSYLMYLDANKNYQ